MKPLPLRTGIYSNKKQNLGRTAESVVSWRH
jgi:hypothetical protein